MLDELALILFASEKVRNPQKNKIFSRIITGLKEMIFKKKSNKSEIEESLIKTNNFLWFRFIYLLKYFNFMKHELFSMLINQLKSFYFILLIKLTCIIFIRFSIN